MLRPSRAGILYFCIVFAAGFVLGVVRENLLVPRLGGLTAVVIEIPVMLTLSWVVCARVIHRCAVPEQVSSRIWMGGTAFLILMLAEASLGLMAAGRTLSEHLATFGTARGLIGLTAQIAFAAFPAIQLLTAGARR